MDLSVKTAYRENEASSHTSEVIEVEMEPVIEISDSDDDESESMMAESFDTSQFDTTTFSTASSIHTVSNQTQQQTTTKQTCDAFTQVKHIVHFSSETQGVRQVVGQYFHKTMRDVGTQVDESFN